MTISYSSQRGTVWVSAAAFEKSAFSGPVDRRQALHICCDFAPPWHPPSRWPNDGLRRVGDVCDDDEAPVTQRFVEVAEDSDDEYEQLQEALRQSRLQKPGGEGSSSSSSSQASPQARALQELAGCSFEEAEKALQTFGSADAAADALLGGMAEPPLRAHAKHEEPRAETRKRPAEFEAGEWAKKPMSAPTGGASASGAFAQRLSCAPASIDLDD
ncbi:adck1 [Symbiodinium natans]|uniref:Adck1 protein n=1 Tax=Symbiodinium natans TaxID=878477 RepID=A0A812H7N4_9DINO|nr:adck1 [Symbiodinium natans]